MKIKDSGTRRQFETGAVRDMQEGKGRMDLLPWCALLRMARHFEAGAIKYGDRNWERGIPLSSFLDSAARHLAKYMDGQDDEDHLVAAAWNLLCALWTEEKRPDLINIPSRPEYAGGAQYGREDEAEMLETGATISKEETVEDQEPATKKKIDTGKIGALRKAGWSVFKIAEEMDVTVPTIRYHLKKLGLQ